MPTSILNIKRTGTITHDPTGVDETLALEYTVTVNQVNVPLSDVPAVTAAAWAWGGGNTLPKPFVTTMGGAYGTLTCKSCKLTRREDNKVHWIYAVQFDNKQISAEEQERAETPNPLDRLPRVNRTTQMIEMPVEKDIDGDPLLNSANQKPLDPLMLPSPHDVINVECYYAAWPTFYDTLSLKRTINSTAVTIKGRTFAAKTLWFHPGSEDEGRTENGYAFFTVRFQLVVAHDTWPERVKRLSVGYEHLVEDAAHPGEYQLVKIKLPNGEEPREPLMLDVVGFCPFPQIDSTAYYMASAVFEEVDFNTAGPGGGKLPGIDP